MYGKVSSDLFFDQFLAHESRIEDSVNHGANELIAKFEVPGPETASHLASFFGVANKVNHMGKIHGLIQESGAPTNNSSRLRLGKS